MFDDWLKIGGLDVLENREFKVGAPPSNVGYVINPSNGGHDTDRQESYNLQII